MAEIDFLTTYHNATERDYLARMVADDKAACAEVAKRWGEDYWDGERRFGFGGYHYDGRWRALAERMVAHYDLKPGMRILDVGCGKGFLLYEFTQVLPGLEITGIDISAYALSAAKTEVRPHLLRGCATDLPWDDDQFDLVYSINTLHNLAVFDLFEALREIERVGRHGKYVCVESYRDEREKVNLMCWQLTCESFYTPREWQWVYDQTGYQGDHGEIFFE